MFLQIHNKDIHFTSRRYLEIKHDDAIIVVLNSLML